MRKVSVKSKRLFYFMENNKIEDSRETCPQLWKKGEINIWLIQKVDYLRKIFLVLVNICDKDLVWESV
nr:MAG TPA: hypothetical protein [Caudoviricetes sp.]